MAVEKIQGKTDAYNVYRNKLDLERELLVMDNFNSSRSISRLCNGSIQLISSTKK
jgi:hypothetical protein